jgi:hypothetical protein
MKREQIGNLVDRAERLAKTLRAQAPPPVLRHTGLHAGNVLIDADGDFYLVDWDEPLLSAKERDLMFIGGAQGFIGSTAPEEERLFYQGYGQTAVDPVGLAYYRYERIVQDIAAFCKQLLLTDEGGADRQQALRRCFQCVHAVSEGYFIFDLNTRLGLQRWNSIHVDESSDEALIITRGLFDGQSDRAWTRISGFARRPDGLYERFDETAFNTAFELEWVKNALLEVGWQQVHFARVQDLPTPLTEPEKEGRVFIVAGK